MIPEFVFRMSSSPIIFLLFHNNGLYRRFSVLQEGLRRMEYIPMLSIMGGFLIKRIKNINAFFNFFFYFSFQYPVPILRHPHDMILTVPYNVRYFTKSTHDFYLSPLLREQFVLVYIMSKPSGKP
jgi:hypothetical protein